MVAAMVVQAMVTNFDGGLGISLSRRHAIDGGRECDKLVYSRGR